MRRRSAVTQVALAALSGTATLGGCSGALSDLASFLGDPFGDIGSEVRSLDQGEVEDLMAELMLRFRSYLALREAIAFETIDAAPERCISDARETNGALVFVADVPCTFTDFDPTVGAIEITQQQLADNPTVFRFELDYRDVVVGDVEVSGTERITETAGSDGASVRRLDLTQNGLELDYEFRAGLVDGDTPVFDYTLEARDGGVLARVTNPTTAGGFVTVILTGLDGQLQCEVRNTLWTPERLPRGTCDNGVTFGLPDDD